jgi:hypothetical protein
MDGRKTMIKRLFQIITWRVQYFLFTEFYWDLKHKPNMGNGQNYENQNVENQKELRK